MQSLTCPECKAIDFSGSCPTCFSVKSARIVSLAVAWTLPALYPREVKRDE